MLKFYNRWHLVAFSVLLDEIKYKNYSNEAKTFAIAKKREDLFRKLKKRANFPNFYEELIPFTKVLENHRNYQNSLKNVKKT